jgi:hypothetical protein
MAFKRLSSEEMLQLSGTWVDPKSKAHKAILASADLAPAMPRLTAAHEALAKLTQPASADPRLAAIVTEEAVIDPRHDDIIRGAHGLLTGAAFLLGADGAELLALRDTLFPDGLSSTQKSYRAEAGQAAQLATRLTPALRAQLASIVVGPKGEKKTLEHFIDELLTVGARLGVLEDEKGRLQPGPAEPAGSGVGAALLAARNQWVRVGNALVANGEVAGLSAETDKLVFGPLRAAEKAAERRAGNASGNKKAGAGEPDPTVPEAVTPSAADAAPPKK